MKTYLAFLAGVIVGALAFGYYEDYVDYLDYLSTEGNPSA